MDRLTEKEKYGYASLETGQISECSDKLGKLEDLMEKYEINSIEELEEILKENNKLKSKLARWLALLETDGIDSKNMVATDIQHILEENNK